MTLYRIGRIRKKNIKITIITFEEKSNYYVFINGILFLKKNDLDLPELRQMVKNKTFTLTTINFLFELSQMVKGKTFTLTTCLVKNSPKLMDDLFYAKENEYYLNSVKLTKHHDPLIGDFFTEANH